MGGPLLLKTYIDINKINDLRSGVFFTQVDSCAGGGGGGNSHIKRMGRSSEMSKRTPRNNVLWAWLEISFIPKIKRY